MLSLLLLSCDQSLMSYDEVSAVQYKAVGLREGGCANHHCEGYNLYCPCH